MDRGEGNDVRLAVTAVLAAASTLLIPAAASPTPGTAAPTVASFSPGAALAGASVSIAGSNLAGATEVDFADAEAAIVSNSATKIVAKVPPDAAVGPITVTTGGGTATSAHDFKPIPRLLASDPDPAQAGDTLTLTGTNLADATMLKLGAATLEIDGGDATELDADALPDTAVTGQLRVTTPGGTSAPFTIHVRPTIDELSATEGTVGTTVTLTGNTFAGTSRVTFGAPAAAASFHVVNRTTLTAKVPANAVSGPITVRNAGGNTDSDDEFAVLPTVTSFSPASGAAGTTVTINGSGFADTNEVSVGAVDAASFRIVSGSRIVAVVAPWADDGAVEVTNAADTSDAPSEWNEKSFLLRGTIDVFADPIDPALAYTQKSWELERLTCRTLLTHPTGDPVGLEPDTAASMPTVSSDGKTYTFTVRDDAGFANPWNEPITAETFANAIERALSPELAGPGQAYLGDISGAHDFVDGDATTIDGLDADGQTLTITLDRPEPDFVQRIALPFFCALPLNTPWFERTAPIAPAGPYRISHYGADGIVLKRNPEYRGPVEANPDRIQLSPNEDSASSRQQLLDGTSDFAAEGLTGADWTAASRSRPSQGHTASQPAIFYLALNTQGDVLSSPEARQAVNLVVNRAQLTGMLGPSIGSPTDQILPPSRGFGFRDAKLYPLNGPSSSDLRRANALIDEAGVRQETVTLLTCETQSCAAVATAVAKSLAKIGLETDIEAVPDAFAEAGDSSTFFDLALVGWKADYADPSAMLNVLLDGSTLRDTGNTNLSYLDDPDVNAALDAAEALSGQARLDAYAALDALVMQNVAPVVPITTINRHDFLSSRVGCAGYDANGIALGALCLS
jgi:ABC-type oligopeptide transport system substrate-binding subunit